MDIQLTEEQELLRSSIQRFLREQYDFDERRKIVASEEGWSRRHWKSFAELGLCAAPFQESSGGLGGGSLATMIVMQEFGRNLVVEPYFETVVLAGGLIEDVASPEQREAFLPKIMEGEAIWALAWAEGRSRYDFNNVTTTARRHGDNFVLSGTKAAVIGAPWADKLIVSARTSGEPRDRFGVSLFVVDRHSANLHLQSFKTIDGRRAAELTLMNVEVPASQLLGLEGWGVAALEACRDSAIAALCAEASRSGREDAPTSVEVRRCRATDRAASVRNGRRELHAPSTRLRAELRGEVRSPDGILADRRPRAGSAVEFSERLSRVGSADRTSSPGWPTRIHLGPARSTTGRIDRCTRPLPPARRTVL